MVLTYHKYPLNYMGDKQLVLLYRSRVHPKLGLSRSDQPSLLHSESSMTEETFLLHWNTIQKEIRLLGRYIYQFTLVFSPVPRQFPAVILYLHVDIDVQYIKTIH